MDLVSFLVGAVAGWSLFLTLMLGRPLMRFALWQWRTGRKTQPPPSESWSANPALGSIYGHTILTQPTVAPTKSAEPSGSPTSSREESTGLMSYKFPPPIFRQPAKSTTEPEDGAHGPATKPVAISSTMCLALLPRNGVLCSLASGHSGEHLAYGGEKWT